MKDTEKWWQQCEALESQSRIDLETCAFANFHHRHIINEMFLMVKFLTAIFLHIQL